MSQTDYEISDAGQGAAKLRLIGDWTTTALGRLPQRLDRDLGGRKVESVDTRDLGRFDTAGALALVQASRCGVPPSAGPIVRRRAESIR
jgi:phospholipid/cholesterol/gamma-HCH transport system permease protein